MNNATTIKDHPTIIAAEREIGRFHHLLHPNYVPFQYSQTGSLYRMIPAFKFGRMMIEEFKALDVCWSFEVLKDGFNIDTISVEIKDGLIYHTDAISTPTAKVRARG